MRNFKYNLENVIRKYENETLYHHVYTYQSIYLSIYLSILIYKYKYLNCTVNKTTNTGHITNINNNMFDLITPIMILFVSSWSRPLKTDLCYLS